MSEPIPPGAFRQRVVASDGDIDELGHVNNAVWVRWIQDVAVAHWRSLATAAEDAAAYWVVTRHEIDYRAALLPGEAAIGATWVPDPPRGARFDRRVCFVREHDGRVLIDARTTWAMIDRASGRPMRVPAELADRFRAS